MIIRKWIAVTLAILCFIAGFLILYEQYLSFGVLLQIEDVHHEALAMSSVALGIGILIGVSIVAGKEK